MTGPGVPYAGIATRAIALAADMAIVQAIVFAGGAVLALVASLAGGIDMDDTVIRLLAAAAWAGAVCTYFVTFWATAGQTPAMRMMDLRVCTAGGEVPGVGRSIVCVPPVTSSHRPRGRARAADRAGTAAASASPPSR